MVLSCISHFTEKDAKYKVQGAIGLYHDSLHIQKSRGSFKHEVQDKAREMYQQ